VKVNQRWRVCVDCFWLTLPPLRTLCCTASLCGTLSALKQTAGSFRGSSNQHRRLLPDVLRLSKAQNIRRDISRPCFPLLWPAALWQVIQVTQNQNKQTWRQFPSQSHDRAVLQRALTSPPNIHLPLMLHCNILHHEISHCYVRYIFPSTYVVSSFTFIYLYFFSVLFPLISTLIQLNSEYIRRMLML